jgi:hypothetical protein
MDPVAVEPPLEEPEQEELAALEEPEQEELGERTFDLIGSNRL